MWLQGAGPVLWSVSMSLAPSRAFAGHPPSHQEASVVRRAAVLRAPASAGHTADAVLGAGGSPVPVDQQRRLLWLPRGRLSCFSLSGPYLTPGSSCEVPQSPFSSLGMLVGGAPPGQGWCGGVSRTLPCRLSLVPLFVSGRTPGALVMCFAQLVASSAAGTLSVSQVPYLPL